MSANVFTNRGNYFSCNRISDILEYPLVKEILEELFQKYKAENDGSQEEQMENFLRELFSDDSRIASFLSEVRTKFLQGLEDQGIDQTVDSSTFSGRDTPGDKKLPGIPQIVGFILSVQELRKYYSKTEGHPGTFENLDQNTRISEILEAPKNQKARELLIETMQKGFSPINEEGRLMLSDDKIKIKIDGEYFRTEYTGETGEGSIPYGAGFLFDRAGTRIMDAQGEDMIVTGGPTEIGGHSFYRIKNGDEFYYSTGDGKRLITLNVPQNKKITEEIFENREINGEISFIVRVKVGEDNTYWKIDSENTRNDELCITQIIGKNGSPIIKMYGWNYGYFQNEKYNWALSKDGTEGLYSLKKMGFLAINGEKVLSIGRDYFSHEKILSGGYRRDWKPFGKGWTLKWTLKEWFSVRVYNPKKHTMTFE